MTADYLNADPRDEIVTFTPDAVPTLVVRVSDYPMNQMGTLFDDVFSNLAVALAETGVTPVGAPFSLHTRMPTETSDFEVGVPVDAKASGVTVNGVEFIASELPSGNVATISHIGPWDDLPEAWGAFMAGVAALGATPAFPFWEVYVTDPSSTSDPMLYRTDLYTSLA